CGLGGVGGICVDALYRSGFKNLTLIDADKFEITNQNRQIHSENIGEEKAKVFERIYKAKGIVSKIDEDFLENFDLSEFDLIIDAIDDIPVKVALAHLIDFKKQIFISSTGGARKLDPTRIKTTSIFKTHGDALAKKFRYELRKSGFKGNFDVVFSDEEAHCKDLGSFMGVTASFGLALASLAMRKVLSKYKEQ
ncbi:ThiF family adenylyltransferase, partial [Campylobacter jejuni]